MNSKTRILRKFDQYYPPNFIYIKPPNTKPPNTMSKSTNFWVSGHGEHDSSATFVVPPGITLIFTTGIGKLGEGQNYQEAEMFNNLKKPALSQILTKLLKNDAWGRVYGTVFSERTIYNEGATCPDIHLILDDDEFIQGFYLLPIQSTIDYFLYDDNPAFLNRNQSDFYWLPESKTTWCSRYSEKVREALGMPEGSRDTIVEEGVSDSTADMLCNTQRSLSNILRELCNNGLRNATFIVTICRPLDTYERPGSSTYDECPKMTEGDTVVLQNIEYQRQLYNLENIQYISPHASTIQSLKEIVSERAGLPISYFTNRTPEVFEKYWETICYLENLPHVEYDTSYQQIKQLILRKHKPKYITRNSIETARKLGQYIDTFYKENIPTPTIFNPQFIGKKNTNKYYLCGKYKRFLGWYRDNPLIKRHQEDSCATISKNRQSNLDKLYLLIEKTISSNIVTVDHIQTILSNL